MLRGSHIEDTMPRKEQKELNKLKKLLDSNRIEVLGHIRDDGARLNYPVVKCRLPAQSQIMCAKNAPELLISCWKELNLDPSFYTLLHFKGQHVFFTVFGEDVFQDDTIDVKMFINVAEQLKHLHSFGLIHGDIKLENVVKDGFGIYRLIDFDMMEMIDDTACNVQEFLQHRFVKPFGTAGCRGTDALLGLKSFRADFVAFLAMLDEAEYPMDLQKQLIEYYYTLNPWDVVDWDRIIGFLKSMKPS